MVLEKVGKVLVVDDDVDILTAMRLLLKSHVEFIHTESNPDNIPARMRDTQYDVILLDMNFSKDTVTGSEGFHWLEKIIEIDPSAVVIMITAYGDVDIAVKAIKDGAVDFVLKPWQNEKLVATVSTAVRLKASRSEVSNLKDQQKQLSDDLETGFKDIVGESPGMLKAYSIINKVAETNANVLILGESGTGKELFARALHRKSVRKENVFISVDMGAISESLFESELFGHKRGAFTDAKSDRAGRFEVASSGTLFLDEIGNLSFGSQSKLLSALENRFVTRLGSNRQRPIDIRLVCATNMSLYDMVKNKEFRQDLLYRINTVEIALPPLRERQDDIPKLIEHYLDHFASKYKRGSLKVNSAAMKKLKRYSWPGNIRELKHAVERAVIMCEKNVLQPSDFFFSTQDNSLDSFAFDSYNLDDVERAVVTKAIQKHSGNISHAAEELGLTRTSLYRRIEKYGL